MSTREQLDWEARWGRLAALAAFLSVVLTAGSGLYVSASVDVSRDADRTRELLRTIDSEAGVFTTGAVIGAVGGLLLAVVLLYLYRVTKFRRPEMPAVVLALAIAGPLLLGVAGVLVQLNLIDKAGEFLASGPRTEARADDLAGERPALLQSLGLTGALILAFATVMLSQNAIRAGVLSRFLGVLGIVVGALYVLGTLFPLGTDLVRLVWLIALGLLFLGRWPGGRGPAWETGEAIEWPTTAQRRALAEDAAADEGAPAESVPAESVPADPAHGPSRSRASRKRKKKKRR